MIRKAILVIRLAGQDLKGNAAVHAVALLIITAAFVTVGVFVLVAANLQALARHWEEKVLLCVYLSPDASDSGHLPVQDRLLELAGVEAAVYVGRDQALDDFKKMLGDEAGLLEGLDQNPLPASFTVSLRPDARSLDKVKQLSAAIETWPEIEEVDYGGQWLDDFQSALGLAQAGVLALGGLIVAAVVFIISNTIRLTMYSRKEEIAIMRLVGAPTLLIRFPFVLEGVTQGAGAAVLAMAALYLLFRLFLRGAAWPGVLAGFNPVFLGGPALLALLAAGVVLGAAASLARFSRLMRT